jgi:hypothetical protein
VVLGHAYKVFDNIDVRPRVTLLFRFWSIIILLVLVASSCVFVVIPVSNTFLKADGFSIAIGS